ncbi:TetR family transcriptional regulator C-terminal domain-containing protein, partial [Enterobacter kobei]|nr:TetR family transcriptional regulator C-terminal domain-containing protein [Enterobacter kobei]
LEQHFDPAGPAREQLIAWFEQTLHHYCQTGKMMGCLTVKLSAEVCDLSEDMRAAMDRGASQIIALLGDALEKGRQEGSLAFDGEAMTLSQVLYSLWLGA